MIQLCLMVKNGSSLIRETLESYRNKVDRIVILDTGSTDDTISIINSLTLPITLYQEPFINFKTSRNRLLDLAFSKKHKWTIMIDDSYELIGDFSDLATQQGDCYCIKIKTTGHEYLSARILRTNNKSIRFVNDIHETLNTMVSGTLTSCYINDLEHQDHVKRTLKRNIQDLKILRYNTDPRSLFYIATTRYNLFKSGLGSITDVITAFESRINAKSSDYEETMYCLINLGSIYENLDLQQAVRHYLKAATTFPSRAGECCYYAYLVSGDNELLQYAYTHRHLGITRMPVDKHLYSNKGIIATTYNFRTVMIELNECYGKCN